MSAYNCYYPLILYLADENVPAKILSYNRANRAVAILCNHQRAPPKTFEKSMQNLQTKVRGWNQWSVAEKQPLCFRAAAAMSVWAVFCSCLEWVPSTCAFIMFFCPLSFM